MKTARFSKVVEAAGKPELHLLFTEPALDRTLQAAAGKDRVMTVYQNAVGTKPDYGAVGLDPGKSRQFLIFPKSLSRFKEMRVVGVKYELLREEEPKKKKKKAVKAAPKKEKAPHSSKVVAFPTPAREPEQEDTEWKSGVRRAMRLLEEGKQVAAFNVLKRLME